ncbi:MAG: orotate phosphoribosyltransferase [Gemmatimonadales bacterium]
MKLLRERSYQVGSFTLASGQETRHYIDARRTTMSSAGLELIGHLGLAEIRRANWRPQVIGGLTLGADPISYAIALASRHDPPQLDAFTVRKERKRHGLARQIEGCFWNGARVVVIEDVVTTGGSALRAIEILGQEGAAIAGVLTVVDRQEGGKEAIERAGYSLRSLVTLADLVGDTALDPID